MATNRPCHCPSFFVCNLCLQLSLQYAGRKKYYDVFHTVHSHTFHDLIPNTAYTITISAINKAGSGRTVSTQAITEAVPGSDNSRVYTYTVCNMYNYNIAILTLLSIVPPHVRGFTASSPTPTSIAVSWNQTTAAMDYYKVIAVCWCTYRMH